MRLVALAFTFLALLPLAAQGPATMPVSEIRAGMKGYGRTVFQGGKIDRFEFEVLGVQKNAAPGRSRTHVAVRCRPAKNDFRALALMWAYLVTWNVSVEWHRSHCSDTSPRCES